MPSQPTADPPRARLAAALAAAAICLCALAFVWRPLLLGEVFLPVDALLHAHPWRFSYERVPVNNPLFADQIRQIYPRRLLVNEIVARGGLPLWNPTVLSGMPMLDDGQLAFFYPPSLLFFLVPLNQAFGAYAYLQLVLAGLGGYAFARLIGLGRGPAALAGVAYMLNGHLLTWLQFPHHSGAHAMLPWAFWAVERALRRQGWLSWALAGVPLALLVLTQIQLAFYAFTAIGAFVLWRAAEPPAWRDRLLRVGGLGLALAVALALSAVQLLPALALSAEGQRADVGFSPPPPEAHMVNLLRLLLPAIGGVERIGPPPTLGPPLLQVPHPYVGLLTLALAAAGLALARHRLALFFGLLAIGSFLLGLSTPLLQLLLALLPPYRQFDIHLRWLMLWGFGAAVLAGMGAQALWGLRAPAPAGPRWPPARLLLLATAGAGAIWALLHVAPLTPASRYGEYLTMVRGQPLRVPLLVGALSLLLPAALALRRVPAAPLWVALVALLTFDLWWNAAGFNTSYDPAVARPTSDLTRELAAEPPQEPAAGLLYPPTRQTAFLQRQPGPFRIFGANYDVLTPNLASAYGLEDIRGYMSLYAARYNRFARMVDGKDYTRTGEGTASLRIYFSTAFRQRRMLDMLNVRYFIFAPGDRSAEQYAPLELVHESDEGRIYRNPTALPRAWLVHRAEVIAGDDAQLARMAQPDFDPATTAIVPAPLPDLAPPPAPEPEPIVGYTADRVTVRVRASSPALLVLADTFYAGWQARVNGEPAPIVRTNHVLRGVWLPAGDHTVEFVYRPLPLLAGAALSLATCLALAGVGVWRRARRRR